MKNTLNVCARKGVAVGITNASPGSSFSLHVADCLLGNVYFSDDDVLEAIMQLKPRK